MKNIVSKYEDNSNKVEAIIEQKFKIIDNIKNQEKLTKKNFVDLDKLERSTKASNIRASK